MRTCVLAVLFGVSCLFAAASVRAEEKDAADKGHLATSKEDLEIVAKQSPEYPLTTCVVTGETLGGMGATVNYIYKGRLVEFCCKGCPKDFAKNPDKYMAMIDEAAKKAGDKKKPESSAVKSSQGSQNEPASAGDMGGCGGCGGGM